MAESKLNEFTSTWEERRKRAGLTQEDVAGAVKVHKMTVSRWELGKLSPSSSKLIAVENLLTDKGQPHPSFS